MNIWKEKNSKKNIYIVIVFHLIIFAFTNMVIKNSGL